MRSFQANFRTKDLRTVILALLMCLRSDDEYARFVGRLKTSEYDVPAEDTATLSAAGENLLYDSAESCFQTHDMCVRGVAITSCRDCQALALSHMKPLPSRLFRQPGHRSGS